jgi:hypothetical protein
VDDIPIWDTARLAQSHFWGFRSLSQFCRFQIGALASVPLPLQMDREAESNDGDLTE